MWKKLSKYGLPLLAIGLLLYTSLRAYLIPITHDEGTSFLRWNDFPLWECFYIKDCWTSANLHLLNSFLMQISTGIFGDAEFFLRLPNLIAHAFYLFFSIKLIKQVTQNQWLVLAGFALLNMNPYLLEFFAFARGYGLALAGMMGSLYYLTRFLESRNNRDVAFSFAAAALAVLSNFAFLNYYACLLAVFCLILLFYYKTDTKLVWKKNLIVPGLITIILFFLLLKPIQFLKGQGEFLYGSSSLYDTFFILVKDSLHAQGYLSAFTNELFLILTILILFLIPVHSTFLLKKKPKDRSRQIYWITMLLLVLVILSTVVQHYFLGTSYLTRRRALILVPLLALPFFLALVELAKSRQILMRNISIAIVVFSFYHLGRTANFNNSQEWYYDMQTKKMATYLKNKIPESQTAKIGVNWLFHPSTSYYIKTLPAPQLIVPKYEKAVRQDDYYDYYYVKQIDTAYLHDSYILEKNFKHFMLMRKGE